MTAAAETQNVTERPGDLASPPLVLVVTAMPSTVDVFLKEQIDGVRAAGYRAAVACSDDPRLGQLRDVTIERFAVPIPRAPRLLALARAWVALFRLFRRTRPALVHTHTPFAAILGQSAARAAGVPCRVTTVHGLYFVNERRRLRRAVYRWVEVGACRMATRVVCVSAEDARYLAVRHRIRAPKIDTFHVGADLDACSPQRHGAADRDAVRDEFGIPRDALVVGVVARMVREKGLPELFEAIAGLARRRGNVHLLHVGPVDESRPDAVTPAEAQRLGILARCRFAGQRYDVARFLAAMDVFCLPSHREGFPVSVMEAAAMGLPCVVTDVRGCREAVVHGQTGLVVPARNAAALERALEELLASPERRAAMSAAARSRARAQFDRRRAVERTLALYQAELGRQRHGTPA
jgi:glycosyltransferase involved in cell wall biosynthesis